MCDCVHTHTNKYTYSTLQNGYNGTCSPKHQSSSSYVFNKTIFECSQYVTVQYCSLFFTFSFYIIIIPFFFVVAVFFTWLLGFVSLFLSQSQSRPSIFFFLFLFFYYYLVSFCIFAAFFVLSLNICSLTHDWCESNSEREGRYI